MATPPFRFKRFCIEQAGAVHPVGTDGVLLGAWADPAGATRVLDIGTGTGLIALFLAQRTEEFPDVRITGIDVDGDTAACASRNFKASPWADRLTAIAQSVQEFVARCDSTFDLIVSNPPFFTEAIVPVDAARRLGRNAVSLPGSALIDSVRQLLTPEGRFYVVLPGKERQAFCEQACLKGLYCTREMWVYSRPGKPVERVLLCFERNPRRFSRSEINLFDEAREWTTDFKSLTKDFYLNI